MRINGDRMSKKIKQYTKWILLIALLFLLLPAVLRALDGNVYLIGEESYYHASMAEKISQEGIPEKDTLITTERDY